MTGVQTCALPIFSVSATDLTAQDIVRSAHKQSGAESARDSVIQQVYYALTARKETAQQSKIKL